jgi:creatinine amidohydrolase
MTRWLLLPLGATEAHGPHLPLDTDTLLAEGLARRVAEARPGARVAPAFTDTACAFAAGFPGTRTVPVEQERRALAARLRGLLLEAEHVALVNLHFDPDHMAAVKQARADLDALAPGRVAFPDFTRRAHAQRLGGEFATGACHGGEFETSLLLALAPERVGRFEHLPAFDVDLARAIREGKRSFRELGLTQAYCGHPATATAKEGERLLGVLAAIVLEELR